MDQTDQKKRPRSRSSKEQLLLDLYMDVDMLSLEASGSADYQQAILDVKKSVLKPRLDAERGNER